MNASDNLLQLAACPTFYDHLPAIEKAMREESRIANIRLRAGWDGDEGGWVSPCGMGESSWEDAGYPFPEDPDYAAFAATYYGAISK
jgi:hypothetical protein